MILSYALELRVDKLEKRIEELEKRVVKCSCPPWYLNYLEADPDGDSIYIRNAGWSCPLHGSITT
jgi:hypothetical protein